jgi:Glu-tRNA(Gln) amidotransferase subunit E-like FAD-binding protein
MLKKNPCIIEKERMMSLNDIPKAFKEEVRNFIDELELWMPLIRLLLLTDSKFEEFWISFSTLHKEKKIYSQEVVDRMKKIILKLRTEKDERYNLSDRELRELLSFSASQKFISHV